MITDSNGHSQPTLLFPVFVLSNRNLAIIPSRLIFIACQDSRYTIRWIEPTPNIRTPGITPERLMKSISRSSGVGTGA